MSDLGVRAAARKEAERAEDEIYFAHLAATRSGAGLAIRFFVEGAVWAAGRLPTRDEIAGEMRKHKLVHVAVSRRSAFCVCDPHRTAGVDDNRAWFEQHLADAVLALIQSRMTT